jgi:large subunit ribosomal protein L25
MAKQVQLKVQTRTGVGRGLAKKLRASGLIPAVVYGAKKEPLSLAIAPTELEKVLRVGGKENVLVDLQVEGADAANRLALIQEVQHHPVSDQILHIDFHEVLATEKLRTRVPVRGIGEPSGVKNAGGILEYVMRDLHVECLPQDLPEQIEVNVEAMEIGQSIKISGIKPPAGVTFLDPSDMPVFIVAAPITEEEEAALGATAAAGEPEVIGAEPAEGEEGAAPAEGAEAKKGEAKGKPEAGAGKAEAKPAAGAAAGKGAPGAAGGAKPAAGAAAGKPAAGAAGKPAAGAAKPAGGKPPAGKK